MMLSFVARSCLARGKLQLRTQSRVLSSGGHETTEVLKLALEDMLLGNPLGLPRLPIPPLEATMDRC
jgi:hypothetical protein